VNERQLRYALSVWRERSFVRAAERLNVAQSAVSAQVKQLEETVGFQLFARTARGVEVTELGRTFLQQAEHAVAYLLGLVETARQLRGDRTSTLSIGLGSGIASYIVPLLLEAVRGELGRTRLEITTCPTQRVLQLVADEHLDVGFIIETDARSTPMGVTRQTVARLRMCLIAPPNHRVLQRRGVLDLETLVDEPMIMNELAAGYGELVLSMFADRGSKPRIAAIVDNVETMKTMVVSGMGVAIVPSVSVRNEVRLKQLATRWIRSVPDASIVLVSSTQPKTSSTERGLAVLKSAMQMVGQAVL
jgi:DNA-binding transcriptional LysR family regulator